MPESKTKSNGKKTTKASSAPAAAVLGESGGNVVVNKQPQSKAEAAETGGVHLYIDDAWSVRYFDKNDLHYLERDLFG